mmetsp:Transcript_15647/g.34015  ORF Transcript_15647/g.34015 Transcript_15647/m.34015 type:complete len:365 (-) Transcript_15647:119-1213(-)
MAATNDGRVDAAFLPYRRAAKYVKARLEDGGREAPLIGIICGTGLSGLSKALTDTISIPYGDIPGFPSHCSVSGHTGELVVGNLAGQVPTLALRGRFHSYEGYDMTTVALPVRMMRCLGVKFVIVTNAAGGLDTSYDVGDVVSIMDHFALPMLAGKNPLLGPNDDELGPRFPPSSNTYDPTHQDIVIKAATNLGFTDFIRTNGLYCFVSGPMYESKAECKFLASIGGSAVGMSTVPEIIAAHHCGMKVLCLSLITNKVIFTGDEGPAANHEEVLDAGKKRADQIQKLVEEIVKILKESGKLDEIEELPPVNLDAEAKDDNSTKGVTLCPYHMAMGIVRAPLHCLLMGAALLGVGAIVGSKAWKR